MPMLPSAALSVSCPTTFLTWKNGGEKRQKREPECAASVPVPTLPRL